ncbi:MAG: ABC transporter permease [Planctomycetota bacterium]|nr:ABC transporter permease [Planctomycetota bacterium]
MGNPLPRWPELRELTRHRTLAFLRQPEAVFWVFAFPMVLAAVLGFAFQGGERAPSVVGMLAGDPAWRAALEADELIEVEVYATREEADQRLRGGHVDLLALGDGERPDLRLDPVRAEAELARLRVLVAIGELAPLEIEKVEEKGSRYVDFLFPGLLGMNLMGTGLWAIGFAVADMRQRKVLKRLLVTPMRRASFLASFMLSRLLFLFGEVVLLTAFGVWVLDIPLRANLLVFGALCTLGAVGFAGLGLLAASRVKTIEGVSGMLNLVMMPMWLGSGVFFTYERFPEVIQPVLRALPLTALNDALRATMLDGAGFGGILPELTVLVIWTVLPFVVALKIFRWA